MESNNLGTGAQVQVVSGSGEVTTFNEVRPGIYHTDTAALVGIVGESYTLQVQLGNGESYISSTETIPDPVRVDEPRVEFLEVRGIGDDRIPFVQYGHNLYASLENTSRDHFVKVVASGWWRVEVAYGLCGGFDGTGGPAGPTICWARRNPISPQINLATNQGLSGSQYEILAENIPLDFRAKYIADVSANAMSPEAFSYWQRAKTQLDRGGGIFDVPFVAVVGNIRNVNDPSESVLGYFHAYAKTTTRLCFDRVDAPVPESIPGVQCFVTCVDHWRPAVFELPFDQEEICL